MFPQLKGSETFFMCTKLRFAIPAVHPVQINPVLDCLDVLRLKAKFHYGSWFGASSELASVMEFGFYYYA